MATKTVTLKDSNGDTLYPVTDSNVVNINQQKTLAQALDGVVYAEDPTQSATPTAWVTGSDINWTTTAQSYSTTEVDTGATWVDGKHIYKKTINFGALPNATSKTMAHGISSISWVISIESVAKRSDGVFCPMPLVPPGSTALARYGFFEIDATNIVFYTGYNYSNMDAYVTLWYTKSS